MNTRNALGELLRFGCVGIVAVALHYIAYWVLQHWMEVNIAYTIGYIVSFAANYLLSARFTFRKHVNARNGLGFSAAHLTNYLLQIALLNTFLSLGLSNELAPLAVYCIAIPVNFSLVRLAFHHTGR